MLIATTLACKDIGITTCVNKLLHSKLTGEHCEGLTFTCLFPIRRFGYTVEWDIKQNPIKYFNQCLLNHTQLFISDSDYIYFFQLNNN